MKIWKYAIPAVLIGLFIAGTVYAVTVFNSSQTGNSPANGRVLQTNGTTSTWVATSTLGFTGGSGTSTSSVQSIMLPLIANGTVAGVNATSSTVSFNVQGSGTLNPFNVSSSSGISELFVSSAGLVGIGTSTPSARLSITGGSAIDPFDISSTSGVSLVHVTSAGNVTFTGTATLNPTDYLLNISSSTSGTLFGVQANGNITFNTVGYTFPLTQGGASTVLTNNGSGVLSWATASGGSLPYGGQQGLFLGNTASGTPAWLTPTYVTVCTSGCNYTASGTNDQVGINAAITAVNSAGGGTVLLKAGNYFPATGTNISMKSNVVLMGEGDATKITRLATSTDFVQFSGISNAGLQNLQLADANNAGALAINGASLVYVQDSNNIKTDKVDLSNVNGFGYYLPSSSGHSNTNITITNGYLNCNGFQDCIGGGPFTQGNSTTSDITISNMHIYQTAGNGSLGSTVDVNCIDIVGMFDLIITGNTCYGQMQLGFEKVPNSNSIISSNVVNPSLGAAKIAGEILVLQNHNPTVPASSTPVGLIVNGNTVTGGDIQFTGNATSSIDGAIITNNNVTASPTGYQIQDALPANGMHFDYFKNGTISNNKIYSATGTIISGTTGIQFTSNTSGNQTTNNIVAGFANGFDGASVASNVFKINTPTNNTNNYVNTESIIDFNPSGRLLIGDAADFSRELTILSSNSGTAYFGSTGANDANVTIDDNAGGHNSNLVFTDGGINKWFLRNSGINFSLIDAVTTKTLLSASTSTGITLATTTLPQLTISNLTGTQCLHEVSGLVSGTGSDCGSGGGSGGLGTTTPFTAGYIPRATGTAVTLTNSNIFQSTTGNVGINTTTPVQQFEVNGIAKASEFLVPNGGGGYDVTDASGTTYNVLDLNSAGDLHLVPNFTGANTYIGFNNSSNMQFGQSCCGGSLPASFTFNTRGATTFQTNGSPKVAIDAAGNFNVSTLTASSLVKTDSNKNLQSVTLGTNLSFSGNTLNASGSGSPAGSDTQIQYNNGGSFGASSNFLFSSTTGLTNLLTSSLASTTAKFLGLGGASVNTNNLLTIVPQTTYSSSNSSGGAVNIDNSLNGREALVVYQGTNAIRNGGNGQVRIQNASTTYTSGELYITSTSTSGADFDLRIDSPNPDIEMYVNGNASPIGGFELAVPTAQNVFQINSRNAANNSFENIMNFQQVAAGGRTCIGCQTNDLVNGFLHIVDASTTEPVFTAGSAANNTNIFKILQSGFVGIGPNAATQALTVSNGNELLSPDSTWSSGDVSDLFLGDTNTYLQNTFGTGVTLQASGNILENTLFSSPIQFEINGNERMRVDGTGLVGIGSSTPAAVLGIKGTSGSSTPLFIVASSSNQSVFSILANGNVNISGVATSSTALLMKNPSGQTTLVVDQTATFPQVNIGTTTTQNIASLYVLGTSASTTAPLFSLASSTNTALMTVQSTGHVVYGGASPTMGTCGSSPGVTGNDTVGTIAVGSGVVTSCTLNFANPYKDVRCFESDNSTAVTGDVSATSTTSVTFSFSATLGGGVVQYYCADGTP